MDEREHTLYEARQWLTEHPDGFFADRFTGDESALQFVERLYEAGAERVDVYSVNNEAYRDLNESYTDLMRVTLPANCDGRAALFAICHEQIKEYGEDFNTERDEEVITKEQADAMGDPVAEGERAFVDEPVRDKGQRYLTFWWD